MDDPRARHPFGIPYLRGILMTVAVILVIAALALAGAGWYVAGLLEEDGLQAEVSKDDFDIVVVEVGPTWIDLRSPSNRSKEITRDGVYRFEWEEGDVRVGRILPAERAPRDPIVRRAFDPKDGQAPPAGAAGRLDAFAFGDDPKAAHGIAFEDVKIRGELGDMPAWYVPGTAGEWVIFVHGKGASRREALRMLPAVQAEGPSLLVITYRNDRGAPASPDGRYGFGTTEWKDLEAAVRYAKEGGAERLVLVGYSMGGAIVLSFIEHSDQSEMVEALILDAPMLSFDKSVDLEASDRGLPSIVTAVAKRLAGWRFDISWSDMDYRDQARALSVPVLLFHGDEDDRTPVEESDRLAADRPDIVTYERFEGASHVRAWNVDPARYEAAVTAFLRAYLAD